MGIIFSSDGFSCGRRTQSCALEGGAAIRIHSIYDWEKSNRLRSVCKMQQRLWCFALLAKIRQRKNTSVFLSNTGVF
jgi:hypothetical protein